VCEKWWSESYGAVVDVVRPVAEIGGVDNSFVRASRPNGSDEVGWEGFDREGKDYRIEEERSNGVKSK
jgi:hypothetical protein